MHRWHLRRHRRAVLITRGAGAPSFRAAVAGALGERGRAALPPGDPGADAARRRSARGRARPAPRRWAPRLASWAPGRAPRCRGAADRRGGVPRPDPPARRTARGARARAGRAGAIVAATTIARAIVLSTFDTSHGDAVVGTIWDSYLGELRLWGLVGRGRGPGSPRPSSSRERGSGAWRLRAEAPRAAPRCGWPAPARLAVLAALLVWMPEVPLDLALVSAAGVLVFTAVAEVVRLSSAR